MLRTGGSTKHVRRGMRGTSSRPPMKDEGYQYRDVSLVHPSDTGYRNWCHRNMLRFRGKRVGNPLAADYSRALAGLEDLLRSVLAKHCQSTENRILRHITRFPNGHEAVSYREIDFVVGSDAEPLIFVEAKFKEQYDPRRIGRIGQIFRSLDIARCRWRTLRGAWLNTYTGTVFGLSNREPSKLAPVSQLAELFAASKDTRRLGLMWLSGLDFARAADISPEQIERLRAIRISANQTNSKPLEEHDEALGSIQRFL